MAKTAVKPKKKAPAKKPAAKPAKAPPKKVVKKTTKKAAPKKKAVAVTVTAFTAPYVWEFPRVAGSGPQVTAHVADVEMFEKLALGAQDAARSLADAQNRITLLALSADEVSLLLGKLGRGAGAKLSEKEADVLAQLVTHANRAALMLPGYSDKEVSVHRLVNLLLSAGNLLQEAALRAKPPAPDWPAAETLADEPVTVTESSP